MLAFAALAALSVVALSGVAVADDSCAAMPFYSWGMKPTRKTETGTVKWHVKLTSGPSVGASFDASAFKLYKSVTVYQSIKYRALQFCGERADGSHDWRLSPVGFGALSNNGWSKSSHTAGGAGNSKTIHLRAYTGSKSLSWQWMPARWCHKVGADVKNCAHNRDYSGLPHMRFHEHQTYAMHGPVTKNEAYGLFLKRGYVSGGCTRLRSRDTVELYALLRRWSAHNKAKVPIVVTTLEPTDAQRCPGSPADVWTNAMNYFPVGDFFKSLAVSGNKHGAVEAAATPTIYSNSHMRFAEGGAGVTAGCPGLCFDNAGTSDKHSAMGPGGKKQHCFDDAETLKQNVGKCPETRHAFCCASARFPHYTTNEGVPANCAGKPAQLSNEDNLAEFAEDDDATEGDEPSADPAAELSSLLVF